MLSRRNLSLCPARLGPCLLGSPSTQRKTQSGWRNIFRSHSHGRRCKPPQRKTSPPPRASRCSILLFGVKRRRPLVLGRSTKSAGSSQAIVHEPTPQASRSRFAMFKNRHIIIPKQHLIPATPAARGPEVKSKPLCGGRTNHDKAPRQYTSLWLSTDLFFFFLRGLKSVQIWFAWSKSSIKNGSCTPSRYARTNTV